MIKKIYSVKQKIVELINRRTVLSKVIPIYMFHHVDRQLILKQENICITIGEFCQFIENKLENGVRFITIDEIDSPTCYSENVAVITFDDMFQDAFLHAIPFLRKKNIPYTVFISCGLLNKSDYISEAELEDLKKDNLCTIGAHSVSHHILRMLSLEQKKLEIEKEMQERILGVKLNIFAYPYGSYYACDHLSRKIVYNEYKYGFSTINFPLSYKYLKRKSNFLPRINVNYKNYTRI